MNEFLIRAATLADSEELLKCLEQAFEPNRGKYAELAFVDTVLTPEAFGKGHEILNESAVVERIAASVRSDSLASPPVGRSRLRTELRTCELGYCDKHMQGR